jgi:hypothetical protein
MIFSTSEPNFLIFVDYAFLLFHTCLIFFNLFGWMVKKWRRVHFAVISLTFFSWFVLGIWYGWGYCFLTDWHWQILIQKGETGMPDSYISYLFIRLFGLYIPDLWVDALTVGLAVAAFLIAYKLNFTQPAKNKMQGNSAR